jgi:hypothetical protein
MRFVLRWKETRRAFFTRCAWDTTQHLKLDGTWVPVSTGSVRSGHPYIDILVSPDGKTRHKQTALNDSGFGGFILHQFAAASLLGLQAHATTRYTLANGKVSDPVPLAYGYACVERDPLVQGLFSISEHASPVIGMDFQMRCGKVLVLSLPD